ncbi:MAG TPA: hypothetical protein VJM11_19645 [Nevskiaceae bacterium]|nr:hypothetical protein [Nevskiaceae bacterium]
MDDSAAVVEGLSATLDFVGPDCLEIPHLVVVYLRSAERAAALLPTPAFLEDLDRRRRAVSHFVSTLDEAPRESLKAALVAAEIDVSAWWGNAGSPQQQAAGA